MASVIWLLAPIIIIFNLIIPYFFRRSSDDYINPHFISCSYDSDNTIEFDSLILKSISEYLTYFFPPPDLVTKHIGDLPLGDKEVLKSNPTQNQSEIEYNTDIIHNLTNSKYEIIYDNTSSNVLIIKSHVSYNPLVSNIFLYDIPISNFIIHRKSDFNLNNSIIKFRWKTQFEGEIISSKVSANKKQFCVLYKVKKDTYTTHRFRVIHLSNGINNYSEMKEEIRKSDIIYNEKFKEYMNSSEELFSYSLNRKESYSDFAVKGNLMISSFDVGNDYIAYSLENRQSIYIRQDDSIYQINPNLTTYKLFYSYINSVRIINDENLFITYLVITEKGIFAKGNLIEINTTNNFSITNDTILLDYRLDQHKEKEENDSTYIYNMEFALMKLRKFFNEGIYSNNIGINEGKSLIFEFFYGSIVKTGTRTDDVEVIDDRDNKVELISSDSKGNNIVVKYINGDLIYYDKKDGLYSDGMQIGFKSIPKKYKKKNYEALAFTIEEINDEIFMLILSNNGVLLSLDFSMEKHIPFLQRMLGKYIYENMSCCIELIICAITVFRSQRNRTTTRRTPPTNNVINAQQNNQERGQANNASNHLNNVNMNNQERINEELLMRNQNQNNNSNQNNEQNPDNPSVNDNNNSNEQINNETSSQLIDESSPIIRNNNEGNIPTNPINESSEAH